MTILTTAYNCEAYIEKSLYSIMSQQFKNFTCYIFDDMSTDNTVKKVEDIIKDDSRFILIKNSKKLYQPGNYDLVIRLMNLSDEEICVEVDGDDWLPNSNVLGLINETYKDENVWMTSGSFRYSNGTQGFSVAPAKFSDIRKQNFTLSHLRTWKSWLWKKIEQEDLKDSDGNYWTVAGDLSFMFPMFEMSGEKNYKHIPTITYIYNEKNPLNDHKVNMDKVNSVVNIIRGKKEYKKI
jgi:glycosyltransferase involved in cell wall biosynthesis